MVMMHREFREIQEAELTNRYGVVISQENTYQSDALEDLMGYLLSWERYQDPNPTPEKAMARWAQMAKEQYGAEVDVSSYRSFLQTMPKEMIAFYEDETYPISANSELE